MKFPQHLPEWSAYAAAAAILAAVGRWFLPQGPDGLSSLAAAFSPVSIIVWAIALAAAGAVVGAILRDRDTVTHVPLSLCFGLWAARLTAPGPRADRLDLIIPSIPGWPWTFALEIGVWLGLLWIALEVADRVAARAGRPRREPPATGTSEPHPGRVSAAVWTLGAVCWRRIPRSSSAAIAPLVTAIVALGPAHLLLRDFVPLENRKLAGFTLWIGFFLGSAAVLGLWRRGAVWSVLAAPAAVGVAAYVLLAGHAHRADWSSFFDAFGLFALPIDFVAAGGVGALAGKRVGSSSTTVWWMVESLLWSNLRGAVSGPLPGEPDAPPRQPPPAVAPPPARQAGKGKKRR